MASPDITGSNEIKKLIMSGEFLVRIFVIWWKSVMWERLHITQVGCFGSWNKLN